MGLLSSGRFALAYIDFQIGCQDCKITIYNLYNFGISYNLSLMFFAIGKQQYFPLK